MTHSRHGRTTPTLTLLALCLALGCANGSGDDGTITTTTTGITSITPTTAATDTSGGGDGTSGGAAATTADIGGSSGPEVPGGTSTAGGSSTGGAVDPSTSAAESTAEAPSEHFMFSDPLLGGTTGTALGGSFGDAGWTVTGKADRVYWEVPRLVEGSVEFTLANVTLANLPLNDHEVFAMYEGGHGIEHPIGYNPEFRNNAFKSMIRIYGAAEGDRVGKQKIMWGICPFGAPGYHDGTCPCSDGGFFDEPFGGDGSWDGSPQKLRVAWADGVTRYYRDDVEVLAIDWSSTGLTFGPQALYVSLGNPRPEEVDSAGMPIGAVFSNVVIEGWTGPETAVCG